MHKNLFFLKFKKGQILRKYWFDGNNFFVQTSKTKQLLPNFFPPQNYPSIAKLSFSGVLKHFTEIDSKLLFLVKKLIPQKEAKNYSAVCFSTCLKRSKSWGKLEFDGNNFFGQTSETGQTLPKTIFFLKISRIQLN